jgi:rhodanese-related sulfurtransferase
MSRLIRFSVLFLLATIPLLLQGAEVWITPTLESVEVVHQGKKIIIQRNQVRDNKIKPYYSYTSRKCPPFCIQPMTVAPGVETVGELEVIGYLGKLKEDNGPVIVIDARTPKWPKRGMIPGAINIPWTKLDPERSDHEAILRLLQDKFGVRVEAALWNFSDAKTLVLYCNGMWCSQSTNAIDNLLRLGYPADKLKWYRGGMQNWETLGLTTVKLQP